VRPATEEEAPRSVPTSTLGEGAGRPAAGWLRRRRRWLLVLAAAIVAGAVAVGVVVAVRPSPPPQLVVQHPDPTTSPPAAWLSGVSGDGAADGAFGKWRGRPVDIAATWVDNDEAMVDLEFLQPGDEYGNWPQALDIAVGAFDDGESWADAADGDYDRRWAESLTNLRELRADKPGTTYIRFAHEMNGNWYPWHVTADEVADFVTAWRRYRALQRKIFPESRLVFCVSRESVGTGIDWREFFPGARYVDVMAVDYYNQSPYVESTEDWTDSLGELDTEGSPKGLQQHLDFARSVGLPLALPEWSGSAREGDSPAFIKGMYEFLQRHGGDGPGQVLYEIQFNVDRDEGNFVLFDPHTRMPKSAETYQRLW